MHDIPQRIADVILDVEANLRICGKWQKNQPTMHDLASDSPFCADTLSLEQWLQWVFLPRMKQILECQQPLPAKSGIFEYAKGALPASDPASGRLLVLLKCFDDLIARQQTIMQAERVTH